MNIKTILIFITMLLVYVIVRVAVEKYDAQGMYYGWIIGWFGMFAINKHEDKD